MVNYELLQGLMVVGLVCCCVVIGYFAILIMGKLLKIEKMFELENQITEKDIEIQKLKNLIVKLNEKETNKNDHKC